MVSTSPNKSYKHVPKRLHLFLNAVDPFTYEVASLSSDAATPVYSSLHHSMFPNTVGNDLYAPPPASGLALTTAGRIVAPGRAIADQAKDMNASTKGGRFKGGDISTPLFVAATPLFVGATPERVYSSECEKRTRKNAPFLIHLPPHQIPVKFNKMLLSPPPLNDYSSREELLEQVKAWASSQRYALVIARSDNSKGKVTLKCDKGGQY
ncbi:MAG: hypothetical protein M1816_003600 [Peltula sp. TS41687]|nr:MAG: hypothetical protein M1816_003600 [Peltula sp. TS41687]